MTVKFWDIHHKRERDSQLSLDLAVGWLRSYLRRHGPTESRMLKRIASCEGHCEKDIIKARYILKVKWQVVSKAPFTTEWRLPTKKELNEK